ncbi:MAG TPA: iron chelate uptake ABC transporter family permease subunit [Burkholderiales bacterium]|jgi:iron complex transport system permease protein|nr:iron chelate uptake ABC transporter family permease subunit [Burkholderiales bacterium]
MRRPLLLWLVLAVLALAAFALALMSGSLALSPGTVLRALFGGEQAEIVLRLRLPRALAAFGVGGALALAGALMQALLRNALAEPYLLGASGGAAIGALLAMLTGAALAWVNLGAAAGAALVMGLLMLMARRDFGDDIEPGGAVRLLLSGVALAAISGALVALMLALAPEAQLRGMLFWLLGDLAGVDDSRAVWLALLAAFLIAYPLARSLNVLARGDALAQSLGVNVRALRLAAFGAASIVTAAAVATAGTVGFVGLVAPHLVRLAAGNDQRVLLPACILAGGTLLLLADTVARTVAAPLQLPTGAVMSLVGAPLFLALLWRDVRG